MPDPGGSKFLARLGRVGDPAAGASDHDLLSRFLAAQDEFAFEALVRRHERLVWSAIGKVLADRIDAEDAFQATFLVLVRRAKQLDARPGLGPWLYGVAHRVAVKARAARRARQRQEARAAPAASTAAPDLSWQEACDLLHAELDRLPDRYRAPLLLCHLEGKTRDEAAALLGVTVAALRGRLERGREMLRARLSRRGVALSVGLLAAVAAPRAIGSVSPAVVAAALNAVRGAASAHAVALSRETIVISVLSKFTKSAALAVGLFAAAATLTAIVAGRRGVAPAPNEEPPAPKAGARGLAGTPAGIRGTAESSLLRVTVHTPDGKPAAAAAVRVWGDGRPLAEGKTDANGRVDLTVPAEAGAAVVAASAPGFAPDWAAVRPTPPGKEGHEPVDLQLVPDDAPVQGRVVDLEGRPVANCPVYIDRVGRSSRDKPLDRLIAAHLARPANSFPKELSCRDAVAARAAGLPAQVTTDRDGRFRLPGVGKDRVVWLTTRGEATEHVPLHVVTRALGAEQERNGPFGLFGSTFTLRVAPARPLTGTVKDAETGKPVSGMTVAGRQDYGHCEAVSDQDGRFTLLGFPKSPRYDLRVVSAGAAPYFGRRLTVEDTPGLGPVSADVSVRRGVVLTGRVTDPNGRPVRGWMFYFPDDDNPGLKDYPGYADPELAFGRTPWGWLDADGRYRVLAVPGPGVLGVHAEPEARYTQRNKMAAIRLGGLGFPSEALHALAKVDAKPADSRSLARDFRLAFGTTRTVRLDFPGGRPPKLFALGHPESQSPGPVTADSLTVTGLSPGADRAVIVMDEAKTVGAFVVVRGDEADPRTVTVGKLASLSGRLLDTAGKPLAKASAFLNLQLDPEKYDNLPGEFFEGQGVMARGLYTQAWRHFTTRRATTDDDGRFTVTGLLPGQTYKLWGGVRAGDGNTEILVDGKAVKAPAAGTSRDVGDLKASRD